MSILAEAKSCINKTLVAKAEGSISEILPKQQLSHGDSICSINMTNIPEYSVIEFAINNYTCMDGCWCSRSSGYKSSCHHIYIGDGSAYHRFSRSTFPQHLTTTDGVFVIKPSPAAVISFYITYRGK